MSDPGKSSTSNGDGLFYESDGLYADYTYDGNDNRVAIVRADALDALVSGRDRLQRDADYFAEGGVSAIERLRAAEAERDRLREFVEDSDQHDLVPYMDPSFPAHRADCAACIVLGRIVPQNDPA